MHFSTALAALGATVLAALGVSAQHGTTVKVTVGANGNLQYDPANLKAEVGTQVEFSFFPKNHTVTQSSFKDPCHPLDGGFFSGFVPTSDSPSGTTFTITVKDEKPIWFYCGQGKHCQNGMVGAINAPESGNTFEAFKELASKASGSTNPVGGVSGGVLNNGNNGHNSETAGGKYTTSVYTSRWTSNGQAFATTATTTILVTVPAETSSAWTTKPYTSTWTSAGTTFTTTATTTLFTAAPAATESESSTPSPSNGAVGMGMPNNGVLQIGAAALAAAAAAMI